MPRIPGGAPPWKARLAATAIVAAAAVYSGTAAWAAKPPPHAATSVDIFGQPARTAESAGRPLGATIRLFGPSFPAARLPGPSGLLQPLSVVAAHLRGNPGRLVLARARRVRTAGGDLYLVPTTRGWVCVQGPRFATCHRGLLRQHVTYSYQSTQTGLEIFGLAADDVTRVVLSYDGRRRRASLHDNVFYVSRPLVLTSAQQLPALGALSVSYRGGRAPGRVPLR